MKKFRVLFARLSTMVVEIEASSILDAKELFEAGEYADEIEIDANDQELKKVTEAQ